MILEISFKLLDFCRYFFAVFIVLVLIRVTFVETAKPAMRDILTPRGTRGKSIEFEVDEESQMIVFSKTRCTCFVFFYFLFLCMV